MTTKKNNTATVQFDRDNASLSEINAELKRLAQKKHTAKTPKTKDKYDAMYKDLAEYKRQRFGQRQTYETMSDEDISQLDLNTTTKAIKSLQSLRCNYPDRADELLRIEAKFQQHRDHIRKLALLNELQAELG